MNKYQKRFIQIPGLALLLFLTACASQQPVVKPVTDPLASWTEGATKQRITEFVNTVTDKTSPDFVPVNMRIATFDNDGTLWAEKPTYFQLLFIIDRVKAMAAEHPEWKTTQPFQAVLENDMAAMKASGEHGLIELAMATHSGMTTDEFEIIVNDWLASARHPTTGKRYPQMVYQPMLELLDYLRANEFTVFIVSGGGMEFMRPWTQAVYGIPPHQVVGSSMETQYELRNGKPVLMRLPKIHFIDDKETKPVAINRFIGQRPIFAGGNSDGDFEMLQWTTSGAGKRFGLIVHHTDAKREWAYDRESSEGRLVRGLDEAEENGWLLVDMAQDWRVIYPE
ncbi:MAG: haloacid dehalogenase-like hydrolase [Xanthomonadales bacterium]|nr:haloacid dehalogenase-like hydrolase [Xanthomonadales bacterium]